MTLFLEESSCTSILTDRKKHTDWQGLCLFGLDIYNSYPQKMTRSHFQSGSRLLNTAGTNLSRPEPISFDRTG